MACPIVTLGEVGGRYFDSKEPPMAEAQGQSAENDTRIDFLYLSEPDMIAAGVNDQLRCIDVMEEAFVLLADHDYMMAGESGDSHGAMITFPVEPEHEGMPKDGPDRRFMAIPAYLGGRFRATGVKWYGSNMENREHGLPRSIHVFVLNDTDTGALRLGRLPTASW